MSLYVEPRDVRDLNACYFYHTMDLPGYGVVPGEWDLRDGFDDYIGHVDVRGRRALDVGTASGYVAFSLEQRGATVIAYDLSPGDSWDLVPFGGTVDEDYARERRLLTERLNNGFWLAHRALGSSTRLVHGAVNAVPSEIGPVDVAVIGSILLHVRDPFLALQTVLAITAETVVVTELTPPAYTGRSGGPPNTEGLWFVPDPVRSQPVETWWALSPDLVVRFLGVLGFGDAAVSFHSQRCATGMTPLFTVVGRRTSPS
jgi:hypothetical protein